ncbi:hypothetical protein LIER_30053 [Lithospermum erythrorhizon]|uniref:Uncharacterized protein n=1 Tax=Lithospermum erythrorhizon TaxID=34254 RepID=A0AAV3RLC4_LITER
MRRGGAMRGRGAKGTKNVDRVVGGDEPSVEQHGSVVNVDENQGNVPAVLGQEVDLQTKIFDRFLKRDPPKFSGGDSPIQALEFIQDLEDILEPMGINRELRINFAVYRLHGGARDWRENAHRSLVVTGQTPVELKLTEFQTIGEKRGRQNVPSFSGAASSGFQGRPSQRSRFS